MKGQRLSKQLSTSLLDKTFEVDSPYKARQRETIIKNSAPFLGKNYFDMVGQVEQHVTCPVLDTALTLEHIKGATKITHHPLGMSTADGDGRQLRVETEDGTAFLVKYPEPASEAGKLLFHSGNQITKMSEKWARGGMVKELDELKWCVFGGEQMALADLSTAKLWEKDLAIRRTKSEIQRKLHNGHVFFVQKQPLFGTPSFCAFAFCPARGARTPLGSYRLSLEPRKNQDLPTVPTSAIGGRSIRGHGTHGAQFYCLTCLEDIWNGVGLITTSKLADIVVGVDYENEVHQPVQIENDRNGSTRFNSHRIERPKTRAKNGEFIDVTDGAFGTKTKGAADQPKGSTHSGKPVPTTTVDDGRVSPRAGATNAEKGRISRAPPIGVSPPATISVPPDSGTIGGDFNLDTSTRRSKFPQPPSPPTLRRPYSSLSQTIYSLMLAETREHRDGHFTLPSPQHAALLKWKSTILRRTESKVKRNVEFRKKSGAFFYDMEDEDDDTSHDPMYWLEIGGSRGQLVGLVDPGGLVIELTTSECRGKDLSEVFQIVDARVQAEWAALGYAPKPPHPKTLVALKFDYRKFHSQPFPLPSARDHYDDTDSNTIGDTPSSSSSGDISSSSSSEEEL